MIFWSPDHGWPDPIHTTHSQSYTTHYQSHTTHQCILLIISVKIPRGGVVIISVFSLIITWPIVSMPLCGKFLPPSSVRPPSNNSQRFPAPFKFILYTNIHTTTMTTVRSRSEHKQNLVIKHTLLNLTAPEYPHYMHRSTWDIHVYLILETCWNISLSFYVYCDNILTTGKHLMHK